MVIASLGVRPSADPSIGNQSLSATTLKHPLGARKSQIPVQAAGEDGPVDEKGNTAPKDVQEDPDGVNGTEASPAPSPEPHERSEGVPVRPPKPETGLLSSAFPCFPLQRAECGAGRMP
jgi:hypothetical protein